MRKTSLVTGEFYHVYNRGVDKRNILNNNPDLFRFLQAVREFNTVRPIGSIFENQFHKKQSKPGKKLVNIIAFCINPNHYHFIFEQLTDEGISKFMHRLGLGYTKYFNIKYKRSGALFQGNYKSAHIRNNEDLLRLSVYVNWNDYLHRLGNPVSKSRLVAKSLDLYTTRTNLYSDICTPGIVLDQFKNKREYKKFSEGFLPFLLEKKEDERELESLIPEDF